VIESIEGDKVCVNNQELGFLGSLSLCVASSAFVWPWASVREMCPDIFNTQKFGYV
jgi:hypothetical protein